MLCVIVKYNEATVIGDTKMKTFTQSELNEILAKHKKWLNDEEGGERANLSSASLSSADLRSADLRSANLSYANLRSADLSSADLSSADLSSANLRSANLSYADLSYADLSSANLRFIHSADGKVLACMNAGKYQVVLSKDKIAIGCKFYDIEAWMGFDDDKISRMDDGALEWWRQWKELIFMFHNNVFG